MLKNIAYLKFKRFLCAKPEEVKLVWNCMNDDYRVKSISDIVNNVYIGRRRQGRIIGLFSPAINSKKEERLGRREKRGLFCLCSLFFFFARAPPLFLEASHRRVPLAREIRSIAESKENKRQSKIYLGKWIHLHFKIFYLVYYRQEDTNLELNFTFINPVQQSK